MRRDQPAQALLVIGPKLPERREIELFFLREVGFEHVTELRTRTRGLVARERGSGRFEPAVDPTVGGLDRRKRISIPVLGHAALPISSLPAVDAPTHPAARI